MSKNNKPVEASSVHSYSLKVDGPTNLKGVKATTVEESEPLFPLYDVDGPLPLVFPGIMLQGAISTLASGATQKFTFSGRFTPTNLNITDITNDILRLRQIFDHGYTAVQLGFNFTSICTSTAGTVRDLTLQIRDRTTGLITHNCLWAIQIPASATSFINQTMMSNVLTQTFIDSDPNGEWDIAVTSNLTGGDTITFVTPKVSVFLVWAEY